MSPLAPVSKTRVVEVLERMSALFGATNNCDFYQRTEALLEPVGLADFTMIEIDASQSKVVHSTRLKGLRNRLSPPLVSAQSLADVLGDPVPDRSSWHSVPTSLQVEDTELPIAEAWRLGSAEKPAGFVLFHQATENGSEDEEVALTREVRVALSIAFLQLAQRERSQVLVDLFQAKLEAINEVGEMLGSLDIEVLLTKLMELALYIVSAQVGSILLRDKDSGELQSRVEWGLPLEMARSFCDREGQVVYEQVLEQGKPVLILDFEGNAEYSIFGFDLKVDSYLCIPLTSKNRVLGCVNLVNSTQEGGGFSALDREILMTISGLAATSIENAILHRDSLERERYRQSLSIARDIQKSFYPAQAPAIPGLDIVWRTESCDETGGDYFDFITQSGGSLTVAVGDVSGHGIGAALLMASARASLRASFAHDEMLSEVMARLNDQLEEDMEQERFMTMTILSVGLDGAPVSFVNGGHDAPCIYRASRGEVEELGATGMPLGLFAGTAFGMGETAGLERGDVLLFTTDGVWEVNDPAGKMLGKERLKGLFFEHAAQAEASAEAIADGILNDVEEYTGGVPANDDVTLVVIRVSSS